MKICSDSGMREKAIKLAFPEYPESPERTSRYVDVDGKKFFVYAGRTYQDYEGCVIQPYEVWEVLPD